MRDERAMTSAWYVHEAARLLLRDIVGGRPVVEARLLDTGGPVAEAAMEALTRLDTRGIPFPIALGQVAEERQDPWLLLLAEAVARLQRAWTADELERVAFSLETIMRTTARNS
jgi:hypothetical protein